MARLMSSTSILAGGTVPGIKPPKDVAALNNQIFKICRDFGLDFHPTVVQWLDYSEISEIAAFGGFPVRYPHWRWGMEYEQLSKGYEYGQFRISEMVINTCPCYIFCLSSNSLVSNINVIVHATGHNDFFKNNITFKPTQNSEHNMMNTLANHGTRIRRYMSRWGKERVTEFIDHVLRLDTLVDPAAAWTPRKSPESQMTDEREYHHVRHFDVPEGHNYMEEWINTPEWKRKEKARIKRIEAAEEIDLFKNPTRNILGYLRDNAPLKMWQADIVDMLYDEALYFAPQRMTKTINEGWASWVDLNIMASQGIASLGQDKPGAGIIEYAMHKSDVLGGKYSMNPYKLGMDLLLDIEERWNKGRFGSEYEDCKNMRERENWDKELGLGKEKVFEVRKYYDDVLLIQEYFTSDFCKKNEYYEYERQPDGKYVIVEDNPAYIKNKLIQKYLNGGLPEIKLVDPNHRGKGAMLLEHEWSGQGLHENYTSEVLSSIYRLWQRPVVLTSKTKDGEEVVCVATGENVDGGVEWLSREDYEDYRL